MAAAALPKHTIVLVQSTGVASRCYYDYATVGKALDGVLRIYEESLKVLYPTSPKLTYDVADVYAYLDSLADISCLVFDPKTGKYDPHPRDWLKHSIYEHLKSMAG